ncbi:arabinogalactan peptide 13 [Tanacetum coccineum]
MARIRFELRFIASIFRFSLIYISDPSMLLLLIPCSGLFGLFPILPCLGCLLASRLLCSFFVLLLFVCLLVILHAYPVRVPLVLLLPLLLWLTNTMESMKMKLFVALAVMLMAISNVAAQEAPAPAPTSDASVFVPTAVASLIALSFGYLF